jgi:hypothetical protein
MSEDRAEQGLARKGNPSRMDQKAESAEFVEKGVKLLKSVTQKHRKNARK